VISRTKKLQPGGIKRRARRLRHAATDAENLLWSKFRARQFTGVKFRRQHPVGPYIVDFAVIGARVIVEIDGGQHASRVEPDARRTGFLESRGYRVLRFWNHEVFENIEGVLAAIAAALETPSPRPSPAGGRGRKTDRQR